ncbi:dihydroorotase [Curvibacter sp. CHRR-16]|uniref:dihydroorotase n=1 Tax=Curvibacter sp. CHRR-16 TaxID=2835872 RepID=UPI001BD99393|nr:dihydroorotase [Curvibacter sp. CHRR-16]MBT0569863.1 dihydroorotase [Curvibacter sp. CHRR-16]
MNLLIQGGRVIDPASGADHVADIAVADGRIVAITPAGQAGHLPAGFVPKQTIAAQGLVVAPGLVDLCARLRESGQAQSGQLSSERAAAAAGGVTTLVCPPDTNPIMDEVGLVEMLRYRSQIQGGPRVLPLGALTRALAGEVLAPMQQLAQAGCVGFGQAEVPVADTQVLQRALQYAATFGYSVWLRPQDLHLGKGVAASGALATRMGLTGVPVAAETIALHTLFELVRGTRTRLHLCRISSAAGVELVHQAKAEGLSVTCDVSVNSLHLTDVDIGYYDSRMRLNPPLRQQRDRTALRAGLADGTIDALVSDHTPVDTDSKTLPFAEATPGATGVELLLSLALHWAEQDKLALPQALAALTHRPAAVLAGTAPQGCGALQVGGVADFVLFNPLARWQVLPEQLRSRGQHTPFAGYELPGTVQHTVVAGVPVYQRAA